MGSIVELRHQLWYNTAVMASVGALIATTLDNGVVGSLIALMYVALGVSSFIAIHYENDSDHSPVEVDA